MKYEPVHAAAKASAPAEPRPARAGQRTAVPGTSRDTPTALIKDILNIMEQGILFWSAEGVCELHNSRIFRVLEINAKDLTIGTTREDFRKRALARGEMTEHNHRYSEAQIEAHLPYSFDRQLPSGRVVFTNGRPTRGGGYVVTFTDVTEARTAAKELARAKAEAEEAQLKAVGLLGQERERQTEAKLLSQLDEWLQSCKSLTELYDVITHFMQQLLPRSKGELYIYSSARDTLEGICSWNTNDLHSAIEPDSCWSLRRGRSYEFREGNLCFPCEHVAAHQHQVAVEEYLCVPIIAHGDTVGMLHIRFDHTSDQGARIAASGSFAVRCAEHISMAIANVKLRDELHERSIRDELTGLYNRRYFMDAIRRELAQAERFEAPLALLSLDADHFKSFNDSFGHDAGDLVLKTLSERVVGLVGRKGTTCRMGGEEFAVILPGHDAASAMAVAEQLRAEVAATQMQASRQDPATPDNLDGAGGLPPERTSRAGSAAPVRRGAVPG